MKRNGLVTLLGIGSLLQIIAIPAAVAKTSLPVVYDYNGAAEASVWKKVSTRDVPASLIRTVEVEDPSRAFQSPHYRSFLQNDRVVVCYIDCDRAQPLIPVKTGDDLTVHLRSGRGRSVAEYNRAVLKMTTVYYWVNELFDYLDTIGYAPEKKLIVYVDRNVRSPESGVRMENNAFFNDADWTLSFLPENNKGLLMKLMGAKLRATAYDPTVAIHEATHAVFEDLIGQILNSEIYGLHEAFADYFALALVDSPFLGQVMFGGKPMRDASKIIPYRPNMEAHDLGNVVVSALWQIRGLSDQKRRLDAAALETIRVISLNPFATAGDIVTAHLQTLDRVMGSPSSGTYNEFRAAVEAVWLSTGLKPTEIEINKEVLEGDVSAEQWSVSSFRVQFPKWMVTDFGQPRVQELSLGMIATRPGPEGTGTTWYLISRENDTRSTPLWLLYSKTSQSIIAAYDLALNRVTRETDETYRVLLDVGPSVGQLLDWLQEYGQPVRDLYNRRGMMRLLFKRGKVRTTDVLLSINGELIPTTERAAQIKPTLFNRVLGRVLGGEMRAQLKVMKRISFFSVDAGMLPNSDRLPELVAGERMVGYELELRTGLRMTVLLEEFH